MSRDLDDWIELGIFLFAAIVIFIAVDVITEGAIENALVGAVSPIIGRGWAAALELLLLIAAVVGLFIFVAGLADKVRNG